MFEGRAISTAERERYIAEGYWGEDSFFEYLERAAEAVPDKTVYTDQRGSWTFGQLRAESERIARGLHAAGIRHGDRVAAQWGNFKEVGAIFFACQRIGAVYVPIIPTFRDREIQQLLAHSGALAYFSPTTNKGVSYRDMIERVRPELPELRLVVHEDREGDGAHNGEDMANLDGPPIDDVPLPEADQVEAICYTSGTESVPKAVMNTHQTRIAALRTVAETLQLSNDDVGWFATPITHATGMVHGVKLPVVYGLSSVLQDGLEPNTAIDLIADHGATFTVSAAPFLSALVNSKRLSDRRDELRLRYFGCGGSAVPRVLAREAETALGCKVLGAYGSTEMAIVVLSRPEDPEERAAWNFDGKVMRGIESRVVDDQGRPLQPGEEGELSFRGPTISVGYFNAPALNEQYYTDDGWVLTGDLGSIDDEGYVNITGRKKDIIIRGGQNISAREVEDLLSGHPDVAQVAVVSMPDERLGERACAFVVPTRTEAPPDLDELCTYLETLRVAKQKLPERLEIVDEMPMTASGKVQKFVLRDQVKKALKREQAM